jgi:transcriptional regulator with XRE-family HTH domain
MPRSQNQTKSDLSITGAEAALIGARIRQLRGSASQLQFARRLGISREHLSRIESGAQVPGTETLRRLAQVAGVSLDFLVLGASAALRDPTAEGGGAWETALEPLLAGTSLRLPRASTASGRRADRAWQELSAQRKEDIRAFVRRIALVAVAIEALLPAKAAKAVTDELGTALATLLVDRILAAHVRPVS